MIFPKVGRRRIALALNRAEPTVLLLRHEVNACIFNVKAFLSGGPFLPTLHLYEARLVEWVFSEVSLHQALEHAPFLGLAAGDGANLVEGVLEAVRQGAISTYRVQGIKVYYPP